MVTIRDLQAVEARQRQLRNAGHGVTPALEVHRRLVANSIYPAIAAYQQRLNEMATSALAPAIAAYQQQLGQTMALLVVAARSHPEGDVSSTELGLATEAPGLGWPPVPVLVLHAVFTAFLAFVLLAYWEARKETAPEEALLVIIGTLFGWSAYTQQVWNRYLE